MNHASRTAACSIALAIFAAGMFMGFWIFAL